MARVDISIPTASGRRRGWVKRVTGVDRSQRGGFGIKGEFLREGEIDLPEGTVIARAFPLGSARSRDMGISILRVTDDGLTREERFDTDFRQKSLSVFDAIEEALGKKDMPKRKTKTETLRQKEAPGVSVRAAENRYRVRSIQNNPDTHKRASTVAPREAKTKEDIELQKRWFKNPSRLDFEGIDTPPKTRKKTSMGKRSRRRL